MLSQFHKLAKFSLQRPVVNFAGGARFFSQATTAPIKPSIVEKTVNRKVVDEGKVILLTKMHIKQSPLKMKFLVRLVRNAWIPDAVAQMKFSPKHRAQDIGRILNRGIALARVRFNAIPEELFVKEVMVTKGTIRRGVRIMGRGRAGRSAQRSTHVRMKIEVADFDKMMAQAKNKSQKMRLMNKKELVAELKGVNNTPEVIDVAVKN